MLLESAYEKRVKGINGKKLPGLKREVALAPDATSESVRSSHLLFVAHCSILRTMAAAPLTSTIKLLRPSNVSTIH